MTLKRALLRLFFKAASSDVTGRPSENGELFDHSWSAIRLLGRNPSNPTALRRVCGPWIALLQAQGSGRPPPGIVQEVLSLLYHQQA